MLLINALQSKSFGKFVTLDELFVGKVLFVEYNAINVVAIDTITLLNLIIIEEEMILS